MPDGIVDLYSFLLGGPAAESTAVSGYTPITYPLSLPPTGVRSITWSKEEVVSFTESPYNFKRFYYRHAGERWKVTIDLSFMSRENAGKWEGFLLNLESGLRPFYFGDVFNTRPMGAAKGAPVISGAGQSGRVVNTRGWEASISDQLKAGDKLQINNNLYQITRNASSNSSGESTLNIWPSLKESYADGTSIILNNPRGIFRVNSPSQALETTTLAGYAGGISFEAIEAI